MSPVGKLTGHKKMFWKWGEERGREDVWERVTRSKVSVTQAPELGVGKVPQACFSVGAPSGLG